MCPYLKVPNVWPKTQKAEKRMYYDNHSGGIQVEHSALLVSYIFLLEAERRLVGYEMGRVAPK